MGEIDNLIEDLAKKYVTDVDLKEIKRLKERQRSLIRREYIKDWEKKNKERRNNRFLSKKEATIILKYMPVNKETKDIIDKINKFLGTGTDKKNI